MTVNSIKEGDTVIIKLSAPKCSPHRGQPGVVEKIRYTAGGQNPIFFVKFPNGKCELHKIKDLEKI